MKRIIYLTVLTLVVTFTVPQQTKAQFLKKLGKIAEQVGKKILEDTQNVTEDNSAHETSQKRTTSPVTTTTLRKLHATPATKVIVVRNGVRYLGPFSEGVACVQTSKGTWFVIDKEGNILFSLPDGYRPASVNEYGEGSAWFDNGRLMVVAQLSLTRMNAYIYDTKGNVVKTFKEVWAASPFTDGLAILQIPKGYNWEARYIDINGNTIPCSIPSYQPLLQHYCKIYPLREGLRRFYDEENDVMGYADKACNVVIPARFHRAYDFRNGMARVMTKDGLWGYINKSGNYVIQPMFSNEVGDFIGGLALVTDKQERAHFINTQGKIVWSNDGSVAVVREFNEVGGKAYAIWRMRDGEYIVNNSFQKVAKIDLGGIHGYLSWANERGFQWASANYDEDNRIFDWQGNLLADFEGPHYFSEGLAGGSYYYINEKLEVIVRFADTQF